MGGFDIHRSTFDQKMNAWSESQNMGKTVNSPGDDLYFRLAQDGVKAYFASDRKEGTGGMDIYVALLKNIQAFQLKGNASATGFWLKPSEERLAVAEKRDARISGGDPSDFGHQGFLLKPVYYEKDDDITIGENGQYLAELADFLSKNPGMSVAVMAFFSATEVIPNYDIYFCLKRAELAGKLLLEKGVRPEQLVYQGLGSAYPVASPTQGGAPNPAAKRLNQRIEFRILQKGDLTAKPVDIQRPLVSSFMKTPLADSLHARLNDLSYRIEVAQTTGLFADPAFGNLKDIMVEVHPTEEKAFFLCGLYKKWSKAKEILEKLILSSFPNATIRPYVNGLPLAPEEVPDYLEKYPDLLRWLANK